MVEKLLRFRALVGITFPDGRVEAGQLIPFKFVDLIPESWYGWKVEEA
jgi:hypothetical protein